MLLLLLIILAALPGIAFPIVYALTARWSESNLGRALMLNGASTALILMLVVFTVFHGPDYPFREYVRMGVYGLIATMLWTLLITYTSEVIKIRRRKKQVKK